MCCVVCSCLGCFIRTFSPFLRAIRFISSDILFVAKIGLNARAYAGAHSTVRSLSARRIGRELGKNLNLLLFTHQYEIARIRNTTYCWWFGISMRQERFSSFFSPTFYHLAHQFNAYAVFYVYRIGEKCVYASWMDRDVFAKTAYERAPIGMAQNKALFCCRFMLGSAS